MAGIFTVTDPSSEFMTAAKSANNGGFNPFTDAVTSLLDDKGDVIVSKTVTFKVADVDSKVTGIDDKTGTNRVRRNIRAAADALTPPRGTQVTFRVETEGKGAAAKSHLVCEFALTPNKGKGGRRSEASADAS